MTSGTFYFRQKMKLFILNWFQFNSTSKTVAAFCKSSVASASACLFGAAVFNATS